MCMFTLYIVFHRNEEFHDDITTSVQIYIEEFLNEVVQQLEETDQAQQQVWSVHVNGWLYVTWLDKTRLSHTSHFNQL